MKISYVTMQFPIPSETFVTREVRALKKMGINVSVYTLRPSHSDADQLSKERDIEDIQVHDDVVGSVPSAVKWMILNPFKFLGLVYWIVRHSIGSPVDLLKSLLLIPRAISIFQKICEEEPDIVHLYWGHYPAIVGRLLKEYNRTVKITTFIGAYDLQKRYGGTKDALSDSERVFTMTSANLKPLEAWFGVDKKKVSVIYQAIDLEKVEKWTEGVCEEPMRIASVGRLVPEKRMDDVLHVFASIQDRSGNSELVILGDGPDKSRLKRICQELDVNDKVAFLGHVSEARVFEEMARADVFLFMSDKPGERLPNVIKEAMICRCFCISSYTPGMEELIEDGQDGYLVDPGNLEKASRILRRYFANRMSYQRIKDNARQKIRKQFSLSEAARRYKREWEKVIEE